MFRLFDFNIMNRITYDNTDDGDDEFQQDEFIVQMFGVNQIVETCSILVTDYLPFF
jgi:hypothetical protein